MHEFSLLADLMRKIERTVAAESADRAIRVTVKLGALAHISPQHLREHFNWAKRGTAAQEASLVVLGGTDESDPHAQDILLDSIEVE